MGTAVEQIGTVAVAPDQRVVAITAKDLICAGATFEVVVAVEALNDIIA